MKIDCHIHTELSSDSFQKPDAIFRSAARRGLDGVLIVDHNIAGAEDEIHAAYAKFREQHPQEKTLRIFRGGEYSTRQGHIIVVCQKTPLENLIRRQGSLYDGREVIRAAREQGAVVILAHPYRLARYEPEEWLLRSIDAIEVYNGRTCFVRDRFDANRRAVEIARQYRLPITAGTDAHTPGEIGRSYIDYDVPAEEFDFRNLREYKATVRGEFGPLTHELSSKLRYYLQSGKYRKIPRAIARWLVMGPVKLLAPTRPDLFLRGEVAHYESGLKFEQIHAAQLDHAIR